MSRPKPKPKQEPPDRPHPGWVRREELLLELCLDSGMTGPEARREVRKVIEEADRDAP